MITPRESRPLLVSGRKSTKSISISGFLFSLCLFLPVTAMAEGYVAEFKERAKACESGPSYCECLQKIDKELVEEARNSPDADDDDTQEDFFTIREIIMTACGYK